MHLHVTSMISTHFFTALLGIAGDLTHTHEAALGAGAMRKCSEMQRTDGMAGCRAAVTVVFELYMAKGTVCIEHVVR